MKAMNEEEEKPLTKVGSKEYYDGFFSRSLEEDASRGDGLIQALKLGGGVSIGLIALVGAFFLSNSATPSPPL